MKKTFAFILLSIISLAKAQLTDIRYIPVISTDTISTKANLYPHVLSKNKFNPLVFENGFKVGEKRQAVRLWDKDIFYLEFTDRKMNKRVFRQMPELKKNGKLFEIMLQGDVSWYRRYFSYRADTWDANYEHEDYFVKGDEIVNIPVKGRYKKKLKALLSDKPEIAKEVDRMVGDRDIREILEKYNSK